MTEEFEDIRAKALSRGIRLRDFHRERDALLLASFAGNADGMARRRERLAGLARQLQGDEEVMYLYEQAMEIAGARNPRAHAIAILEARNPHQAESARR